jgi:predicted Zn-dependent protease
MIMNRYDGFGINFRLVASHEFGHALGLGHSFDTKSLMYPIYQMIQPENLLPKDVYLSNRVILLFFLILGSRWYSCFIWRK